LTGASSPSFAANGGIAPLITSISVDRPARKSSSIEGLAPGIASPKARTHATGSSKESAIRCARATVNASVAHCDAIDHASASSIASPIVSPVSAQMALKAALQISFSQTSWSMSS
jgi:hypothetical protein